MFSIFGVSSINQNALWVFVAPIVKCFDLNVVFMFLSQITLLNPLCTVAYALASWKFFNDRVTIEEVTLLNFFGYDYMDYQKRVPTGLPFIKGYLLEDWPTPI